jgi:hypothetical protein
MERIANQDENSDSQNGTVTSDGYFRGRELVKAQRSRGRSKFGREAGKHIARLDV